MRFEALSVKGLYRAIHLAAVSKEVSKYKFDLVGVQEVRWEGQHLELGTEFFGHMKII
jgi:hypothetical protein